MELEVRIPPEEVKKRLRSSMSYVKSVLFTPTWRVRSDFAGNLQGNEIRMRVHHAYSNGYTKLLFGRIEPSSYGSRLVIEFRPIRFEVLVRGLPFAGGPAALTRPDRERNEDLRRSLEALHRERCSST